MSQYIVHAAPYSSPNSSKRIKSNWAVQNLKVFQENPNAGGGVFAKFNLVNTSNPKDKKYMMQFSFADTTSMTSNAINRIRKFFDAAYDRQRSSSYGFPQLSDTEKTQIVARINTANLIKAVLREAVSKYSSQHTGYYSPNLQHSEDERLEHAANDDGLDYDCLRVQKKSETTAEVFLKNRKNGNTLSFVLTFPKNATQTDVKNAVVNYLDNHGKPLNDLSAGCFLDILRKLIAAGMGGKSRIVGDELSLYRRDRENNQHAGYYSPNLRHSEPDYLSVKMSSI